MQYGNRFSMMTRSNILRRTFVRLTGLQLPSSTSRHLVDSLHSSCLPSMRQIILAKSCLVQLISPPCQRLVKVFKITEWILFGPAKLLTFAFPRCGRAVSFVICRSYMPGSMRGRHSPRKPTATLCIMLKWSLSNPPC